MSQKKSPAAETQPQDMEDGDNLLADIPFMDVMTLELVASQLEDSTPAAVKMAVGRRRATLARMEAARGCSK